MERPSKRWDPRATASGTWRIRRTGRTSTSATLDAVDYQFEQSDAVLLDDSIIASGGTNVISITTNNPMGASRCCHRPSQSILRTNYTITGPGSIGGDGEPSPRRAAARCRLTTPTHFSGTVTISGGSLLVNNINALGSVTSPVVVTNGGTLDVGGPSFAANVNPVLGSTSRSIFPAWASTTTAPSSTAAPTAGKCVQNLTLAGDAAIGGNGAAVGTWGAPSPDGRLEHGRPCLQPLQGRLELGRVPGRHHGPNLANIDIQGGELGLPAGHDQPGQSGQHA